VTVTLNEPAAAIVSGPHDRLNPPVIVQPAVLVDQITPAGSVSVIVTPVASPCPLFVTVTV
jgi:hypothetical protein